MTCNGLEILYGLYSYVITDHAGYFHQITCKNDKFLTFLTF